MPRTKAIRYPRTIRMIAGRFVRLKTGAPRSYKSD